jgi:hypothetical protein
LLRFPLVNIERRRLDRLRRHSNVARIDVRTFERASVERPLRRLMAPDDGGPVGCLEVVPVDCAKIPLR